MVDQMYDRNYQAGRELLHAGIDRLVAAVATSFAALNRAQFDAPWKRRQPC